jgi:hypothetical protein
MSKHRKFFFALSFSAAIVIASASAQEARKSKPEPLMIQEQGARSKAALLSEVRSSPLPASSTPSNKARTTRLAPIRRGRHCTAITLTSFTRFR